MYMTTLHQFLNPKPAVLELCDVCIREGEIVEINYTYVHSKSLIVLEILKQSIEKLDIVIFFDMSLSTEFLGINTDKVLIYKIFSAPEFFMYK
jgi:hypothetical protein